MKNAICYVDGLNLYHSIRAPPKTNHRGARKIAPAQANNHNRNASATKDNSESRTESSGICVNSSRPSWSCWLPRSATQPAVYVGAGAIHAEADNAFDEFDLFNIDSTSWKALVGLQATRNWGVEASYIDFGRSHKHLSHGAATVDGNAFTAYVTGLLPLPHTALDLYGKAGMARNDVTAHSYTVATKLSDQSVHFAFGGGVRANLGKIIARLEYEQFPLSGSNHGARVASFLATYSFD